MKKNYILGAALLVGALFNPAKAQETEANPIDTLARTVQNLSDDIAKSKRLKITGYIQPQFQIADSAGVPSFAGRNFDPNVQSRFMMRRGRFKFTYDHDNAMVVINTDVSERGLAMRETFLRLFNKERSLSLTMGCLQFQYGFEITQSSGERETPERARFNQTLFPTERDLGVFGRYALPKSSSLYGLALDLAMMNGSPGVSPEFDSNKDYSARLAYTHTVKSENLSYGLGASFYDGGYRTGKYQYYKYNTSTDKFWAPTDTSTYTRKTIRRYIGADAQVTLDWAPGITIVRAEYIQGIQPGLIGSSISLLAAPGATLYSRQFNGAYFYLIQDIGHTKLQLVAKYDWYDPNTQVDGSEIGKNISTDPKKKVTNGAGLGDVKFTTIGFGGTYRLTSNLKVMVYYDIVENETTQLKGYTRDIHDNVTTVRMQYKF